jgi:hypothetical protein
MSGLINIRPLGAELFHADRQTDRQTNGQTDMTNLIAVLRNFAKVPNNDVKEY